MRPVKPNGGYSNFLEHFRSAQANEYSRLLSEKESESHLQAEQTSTAAALFYSKESGQVHSWIDLVVNGLLPYTILSNPVFRRNALFDCIVKNTLLVINKRYASAIH